MWMKFWVLLGSLSVMPAIQIYCMKNSPKAYAEKGKLLVVYFQKHQRRKLDQIKLALKVIHLKYSII